MNPHRRIVLVVDDDDKVRRLVRTVLQADGYEVVEACRGDHALELLDSIEPAVVVLDVRMPGIDGVETCRRVDHERVKVVMLTAGDDAGVEAECRRAGADAFLIKPFSSLHLLDVIDDLVPA
jgi:DNA-binding response OmpR family regulator